MKRIVDAIKKRWNDFTTLAKAPMFFFGFPFVGFATLVFLHWMPIALFCLIVQGAVVIANTDED